MGEHYTNTDAVRIYGSTDYAHLGTVVDMPGDLDGDGLADLLAGEAFSDPGGVEGAGQVMVVPGPISSDGIATAMATVTVEGVVSYSHIGQAADARSDLDGDGLLDLVAGAYADPSCSASIGLDGSGSVYVFFGPVTGVMAATDADACFYGDTDGEALGERVATGPDLQGDGLPDIAAIAGSWTDYTTGRVYVLSGPARGAIVGSSSAHLVLDGDPHNYLGEWGLAVTGDLDEDGLGEVVVGSSGNRIGADAGKAWIVSPTLSGTWDLADAAWASVTGGAGDQVGLAIEGQADLDGDGRVDLVVGAPGVGNGAGGQGSVAIFRGGGDL